MSEANEGAPGRVATIRVRLLAALALALLPVLLLGAAEGFYFYQRDLENRRQSLLSEARLSAATAEARVNAGAVLLDMLTAQMVGLRCAQGLSELSRRDDAYDNLIRFDAIGRVTCASGPTPADADRPLNPWFERVRDGEDLVIVRAPTGFSDGPALLALAPVYNGGEFDGATAAVLSLSSLHLESTGSLPDAAQVALVDSSGGLLSQTDLAGFPRAFENVQRFNRPEGILFVGRDLDGQPRDFAAAPLVGGEIYIVVSSPQSGFRTLSLGRVVVLMGPPFLAFVLALAAVWVATDRIVIRWLRYLHRVASLYAKGRFTVRSVHADRAPPEIRELAETLDQMADTILERDDSLLESLDQKDRLLREIHHRVKNNLQVISSLVSMQQRALEDPVARTALQDTRQRISALSLVYRSLYQGPDLRRVDLGPFLEELTGQMVLSESMQGHAVDTQISADHLDIDPDHLAPLALFTVEAITNAQKHVFAGHGGLLKVDFKVRSGKARLRIADSGREAVEAPELGEGVGRTLMTAFARQLGGGVKFEANDMGGLTAELTFPVPAPGNT